MNAGLDRARQHNFESDPTKFKAFEDRIGRALREHQGQEEVNDRYVSLIVELCVLAESTRMKYREPSLPDAQLNWFLQAAWGFFNSFKHK
jgi:hypothetical protein